MGISHVPSPQGRHGLREREGKGAEWTQVSGGQRDSLEGSTKICLQLGVLKSTVNKEGKGFDLKKSCTLRSRDSGLKSSWIFNSFSKK